MTYDQLVTLDSIITYGSFKAAADYLHKSQPSLSMAIKKLEEEFQILLFNREGYRPVLTAEGKIFYDKARVALMHMKSLQLFGEELGMGLESEIKVGIDGLSPLNMILCNLRNFFEDYNSTSLTLVMDHISGTYNKLLNSEIDLGITPMLEKHSSIEAIEIYSLKMIPLCTSSFLQKEKGLTLEKLKNYPQAIVTDSGPKNDKNFGVLEGGRKLVVDEMIAKKSIITSGLGWGRLPDYLVKDEIEKGLLIKVPLEELETGDVKIYIARNKNKPMGPIAKQLWQNFKSGLLQES